MPVAPMTSSGLRPSRSTNRIATKVMPRLTSPTSTACLKAALVPPPAWAKMVGR